MISIDPNGVVSRDHATLGHVRQGAAATEFRFSGSEHYYSVGRIVLSKPDRSGWIELETAIDRLASERDAPLEG